MNLTLNIDRRLEAVIDKDRCINCDSCGSICPVGAVTEKERGIEGVILPDPEELVPSSEGCPMGIVPQVVASYVKDGRIQEAAEYLYSKNPMMAVCSQVCDQYCQMNDRRNFIEGEPVNIRGIERFVTDRVASKPQKYRVKYKEAVAVVGCGPAGIIAAHNLAKKGYPVTIYEKDQNPGGSMAWGIPGFKMDKDIMDSEIDKIISGGIQLKTGVEVGKDITWEQLQNDYDCVILAVGASKGEILKIEGIEGTNVVDGVSVLREINLHPEIELASVGESIVVIGGSRFAVSLSRTLARKGRRVTCVSMEEVDEAKLSKETLGAMAAEGISFIPQVAPKKIIREEGRVTALELAKVNFIEDEKGKKIPTASGETVNIPCNSVAFAVGRVFDIAGLGQLQLYADGAVKTDKYYRTSENGVFACGDITGVSNSVVGAMTSGQGVAEYVDAYLRKRIRPVRRGKLIKDSDQIIGRDQVAMVKPIKEEKIFSKSTKLRPEPAENITSILRNAGIEEDMPVLVDKNNKDLIKIAIIGGGIAGITAAIQLAKLGKYAPAIFEKSSCLGGRYKWFATDKRIDSENFDLEMDKVSKAGIDVICNGSGGIKPSISELIAAGYKAILFAIGESGSRRPNVPGAYAMGVFEITSLGWRISRDLLINGIGGKVIVTGSDEMAIDVARKLKEYTDDVTLVSACSRGQLLSKTGAIIDALEEGVNLITGAELAGATTEAGRVNGADVYITSKDISINIPCDTLVIGDCQKADTATIIARNPALKVNEDGSLKTDEMLRTPIHGVLSIGNYNASSVLAGLAGAEAVDNYINIIHKPIEIHENNVTIETPDHEVIQGRTLSERGFEVGTIPFTKKQAQGEAARFVAIGYHEIDRDRCIGCGICTDVCYEGAIELEPVKEVR